MFTSIPALRRRNVFCAALILTASALGPASADLSMAPIEEDQSRVEACYSLQGRVPGIWADTDVFLIEDSRPVQLEAQLQTRAPLPTSVREAAVRLSWEASDGIVINSPDDGPLQRAVWYLPPTSSLATLTAHAEIELNRDGDGAGDPPMKVGKSVEFKFLTPITFDEVIDGQIAGYNLGEYPDPYDPTLNQKFRLDSHWHELHPERYEPPALLYRVERAMGPLRISPSLTLGHFIIDYHWKSIGDVQYISIDPNLLEKIEDLIALIKADGRFPVTGITAIYGFRPPAFNLGTIEDHPDTTLKVPFSMHQYGRALDFIIDEDGDLVLDDLNGDGVSDMRDAAEIMHYVNILDRQYRADGRWEKVGGAGLYSSHDFIGRVQSPYIHVDTRGFQRENETLIRWPLAWEDGTSIRWGQI